MISLEGLDKGLVLAALYNNSKPQGLGFLHYDAKPMTQEEATKLLDGRKYFDYLNGRVMKIWLDSDVLDERSYDRGNGVGAAESVINELRQTNNVNSDLIQDTHKKNTEESLKSVIDVLNQESTIKVHDNYAVFNLGFEGLKDELGQALDNLNKKEAE